MTSVNELQRYYKLLEAITQPHDLRNALEVFEHDFRLVLIGYGLARADTLSARQPWDEAAQSYGDR